MKIRTDLIRKRLDEEKMSMVSAAKEAEIPYKSFQMIMSRGTCDGMNLGKLARFMGVKAWELVDK